MSKFCCCFGHTNVDTEDAVPLHFKKQSSCGKNVEESIYTAMYNFTPLSNGDLCFTHGDKIRLLEDFVPGKTWYQAVNLNTGESGNIPLNYLGRNLEKELWWFPGISYFEAETLLLWDGNEAGSFLVRPGNNPSSPYTLSIRTQDIRANPTIKHYKINYIDGSYYISEKIKTTNLQNLIKAYLLTNTTDLGLCENITQPCAKVDPQLYELEHELLNKEEIDHRDIFLEDQPIASGNFSHVYKAKWRDLAVAVKIPKESKLNRSNFIKEVKIMKALRHKNIVTLFGVCTSHDLYYIVIEYMGLGSLLCYLKNHNLSHPERIHVASQVASAMAYLESKRVVHRDLAARNVLLKDKLCVKLGDFGLSRFLSEEREYIASQATELATKWIAPEFFKHNGFSIKSDVWAYAILLMEIYTNGDTPYSEIPNCTKERLINLVENGYIMEAPKNLPENIYTWMKLCWDRDPAKRPSFIELETFFSNYHQLESYDCEI